MANKKIISKSDWAILKWIYSICKSQRFKVIALIFTNAVNATFMVMYANFSKNIINSAVEDRSLEKVIHYGLMFLLVITCQLILNLISKSIAERCKGRLEMIFKKHLLQTIMKKDYSKITAIHSGELQNRMFNDVTVITDGFTTILPNIVFLVTKLVCAFVYLVVIDKIFAFVFLGGGILIFLGTQAFRKPLKRLHKRVQETEGKTRSFIQEAITNLLVVKTFSVEEKISDKTDILQEENYSAKMKRRFFNIAANASLSTIFNIGYVFALVFGALRLIDGTFTYGTVTAMLQLVNQIQSPFAALSSIMPQYFALIASAERLMEIENIPDEVANNDNDINVDDTYSALKTIDFNNITFGYDRDIILKETSLTVNKGDFVAIMGISGIGKSTLLKLLLGVFKVEDGSINLNLGDYGIPVDMHTRRLFSYVPQGNMLLSGTIRENLTFINENATDDEIQQAIQISCADQFIKDLPQGLDTVIGEKGIGLSEGQLQRLAIARSLLSKSPVLLLDEATSALDEETEHRFLTNLKQLDDKTCIIVSHKKAALDICNKHVQISNSKIVVEEK